MNNLLEQISKNRAVQYISQSRVVQSLRKRKARRTLEDKIRAATTENNLSIIHVLEAQDVLGTSKVLDSLEAHGFYEKAADLGYGCLEPLDDSIRAELAKSAAKSGYAPRHEPKDSNERSQLAWRTIQNYLRSARSKPNPFLQACIAAVIAEKFFRISETVGQLEQETHYWEAACLCEGYIAPVTARDREGYYNPLNINKAADSPERKQFAQRAIDNYLRSAPKDVNGAVRIAFDVFGEHRSLEICQQYGVDLHSTMDYKERQMREYHRQLGILASQPFNPKALRQLITKNREILQPETVQMILPIRDDDPILRINYDLIMKRFRATYT